MEIFYNQKIFEAKEELEKAHELVKTTSQKYDDVMKESFMMCKNCGQTDNITKVYLQEHRHYNMEPYNERWDLSYYQ